MVVFLWSLALGVWSVSVNAQTPLSNLVFSVGTSWQDNANNQWSYILLDSSDGLVLQGRRFGVFGKTGNAGSPDSFTQRGTMFRQTNPTAINATLNESVALGDDLNSLSDALNLMFRNVPGITNQTLAQKVASAFQVAATDLASEQLLSLMAKGHPGLERCLGLAFAEQVNSVTTYEVRELDPNTGAAGDVVGRVTISPGTPVVLPAPGRPFQVITNDPSDHLRVRLRWGSPPELRRLAPLQFGYNIWRTTRAYAEAHSFDVTPPTPTQLASDGQFVRANMAAVMPPAELDLSSGLGGAENPGDRLTYFFSDTGRMTGGTFTDGEEFYYFVTARDILGRDGLVSQSGLARACRRLPPAPPTNLSVDNTVLPGSTNAPRLLVSWDQNLNPTNAVTHYWIYRWINPAMVLTNDAMPTNGVVGIVPQLGGTNRNYFLDTSAGALTNANLTNVWYTIRAVSVAACDPLLSPHSAPAWGVLRQRDAPLATTGEVVGSCGTPVVMFQNVATNSINADMQTWSFRFTCVRRDPGITWVQFNITNIVSGLSTQLVTIGPVYFSPDNSSAQLDYPLAASDFLTHTLQVGCIVGTAYDQVSAPAGCMLVAPVPTGEQREAIFYAGQLLATALSASDPLLAVANGGQTFCYSPYSVVPDASGMVAMKFDVQSGTVLLIQALTSNVWSSVSVVTPDANNVYWVPYPACLIGPLPNFQGCRIKVPLDSGCDQHVARASVDGPVAPLRVRFRLTPRTREYRVYRRVGDGPLTLFAQGAALYDPANTNKLIEAKDDAMPVTPTRLCYYVQLLDNQGHGSPLALVGCRAVGALPRPILGEPQPLGNIGNPQVMLNWFCPTSGVARFQIKINRVDPRGLDPRGVEVRRLVRVILVLAEQVEIARVAPIVAAVALARAHHAPRAPCLLEHVRDAAGRKSRPREDAGLLDGWRGPVRVVEVGVHPIKRPDARVEVLLGKQLEARANHVAADAGLEPALPALVGVEAEAAPVRRHEEAGVALVQVLEIAEARVVGAHREDIATGDKPRREVDLIVGPAGLETARRAAAHECAIHVEVIRLVRRDKQRRPARHARERELAAKERVGVGEVVSVVVGPDPLGLAENPVILPGQGSKMEFVQLIIHRVR